MEDFTRAFPFPAPCAFHGSVLQEHHQNHQFYWSQRFCYGLVGRRRPLFMRPLPLVSSRHLNYDVPVLLSDQRYPRLQPKRPWKEGLPQEASRKKPRQVHDKKDEQDEREKEVLMLRKLWETGSKEEKQPEGKNKRHTRRKDRNRKKKQAENDTSSKLIAESDENADKNAASIWKDLPWEQQETQKGESKEADWGAHNASAFSETQNMTETEKENLRMLNVQRAILDVVAEFLGAESDIEDSDSDIDELEYTVANDEEGRKLEDSTQTSEDAKGREEKAFDFFANLLSENRELRKTYEECCNCGLFECFVCAAGGGYKLPKKFSDLVGLVQHARKVLNTKRRPEHRGYGRAVCALLGWDPLRDPVLPRAFTVQPRGCIPPPDEELHGNEVAGSDNVEVDDKVGAKDDDFDTKENQVFKLDESIAYDQVAVCEESHTPKKQDKETFPSTAEEGKNGAAVAGSSTYQDNGFKMDGSVNDDLKDVISTRPVDMQADTERADGFQDNDYKKLAIIACDSSLAVAKS